MTHRLDLLLSSMQHSLHKKVPMLAPGKVRPNDRMYLMHSMNENGCKPIEILVICVL